MKARGERELRVWVPDARNPAIAASLAAQGRAIAANVDDEREIMKWVDAARDWSDLP
jgi:hypothetical protein